METYLTRVTDYLLTQSWQIALLVVVIAAVSLVLRNKSAHVRYLLWLIVLAKCLVPPLLTVPVAILPQEKPAEPVRIFPATEMAALNPAVADMATTEPPILPAEPAAMAPVSMAMERPAKINIRPWLGAGWIVGAIAFLVFNLLKALRANYWLWRKRKALSAELLSDIENLFSVHGIKSSPGVWQVDGISQPFVWGLLRGSIYLSADLLSLKNSKRCKSLLGHELSHIIRFDAAVNFLQVIVQAIFWFHPFVWWANRKIRAEREKCCDEMAIARLNTSPRDYSTAIVETLAAKHESTRPVPSLAVAGPVSNIEERIKTIMKPGKKFYKHPSLIAATVVVLLALLTVPTALVLTAKAGTKAAAQPLHQAVADGDISKVRSLISKSADVNAENEDGLTPLHSAARYGRKDAAIVLLAKGANINAKDPSDQTPLHLGARFGKKFVPALFIAKGANVNARDNKGNTPLHIAAGVWHVTNDLLELLLSKGADVNAKNDKGETPLHYAAPWLSKKRRERSLVLRAAVFLLANGAEVNVKDRSGCTPLYVAARNGRKKVVELLLAKGAIIDEKTNEGMTALHRAATRGHKDVVLLLLKQGADTNARESHNLTALHFAARAGNNGIIELFIAKDADVNAKNIRGVTPAHLAMVRNHKNTVELLISEGAQVSTIQLAAYIGDLAKVKSFIEKGVSVNAKDGVGCTPLHAAAGGGHKWLIKFLINKGADVNTKGWSDRTPLHYATDGNHKDVVELLITKGADVSAKLKDNVTPLHLAARGGYEDLAKLLLARGCDVNEKDQDGETPLHYAAQGGHKDMVVLLLERGANVNAGPKRWGRAVYYASRGGHEDVVRLLIDRGADLPSVDLFFSAVKRGQKDLVEFLIKKGADVNIKDDEDFVEDWVYAPSLYAVWGKHKDVLELLLAHGADPNAKDEHDWSLLHYTAYYRLTDMTRMLLTKGAEPNVRENEAGLTPLHYSAWTGHKTGAELFISQGADVNAKDYYGLTPLGRAKQYAKVTEDEEIVELLRKHGAKE